MSCTSNVTESKEEYLEAMCRLIERKEKITNKLVADMLHVSAASATEMLGKLANDGYLTHRPYGNIILTPRGRVKGKRVIKRHRAIEKLLRAIGVGEERLHEEACALEHAFSDESVRKLDAFLDRSGGQDAKKR